MRPLAEEKMYSMALCHLTEPLRAAIVDERAWLLHVAQFRGSPAEVHPLGEGMESSNTSNGRLFLEFHLPGQGGILTRSLIRKVLLTKLIPVH